MYYLNTDTPRQLFRKMAQSSFFVDKSMMIDVVSRRIGTANKYICVTRPRRFGKTVNACMLASFYMKGTDSSELFDALAIAGTEEYQVHRNRYHVFYIDFSRMPDVCETYRDYITNIIENIKSDLLEIYPHLKGKEYRSVSQMFLDTEKTFVFIMDEWDCMFHRKFMGEDQKEAYLLFLKGLLKDQPYVELAYMTGVLPIAKYSSGSELNMFVEYHAMNDGVFERYFGMNDDEVRSLCRKSGCVSYEELKYWYDGYRLSDGSSLFNPRSVYCALTDGICRNYWTETGPMNEIADCVEHNVDAVREDLVKMVSGILVEADLSGYSAAEQRMDTRDEILSAMVVYGFLAYHDGYLEIPNHELMEKFQRVLTRNSMGEVREIVERSKEILLATQSCDGQKVASILEEVHDREIPFLQYHDENSLSCVITLCYLYARKDYRIEREEKSGKGYCDYLFYPRKQELPAIILELKINQTPEHAIEQILQKHYVQKVADCREVLLVGISYDRNHKRHFCRIERYHKG